MGEELQIESFTPSAELGCLPVLCRACGEPASRSERRRAAKTLPHAVRRRLRRATFPYHYTCALTVRGMLLDELAPEVAD